MNLAQALSAGRWTFSVVNDPDSFDVSPIAGHASFAPLKRPPTPRYKNGRRSPVRDRLLAALKGGRLTRGEIVRRMSGMDSVAVDVLLCRLVQKGLILRTKEPGARAYYEAAGEAS